jgi:tRNA (mo5U34)-methyltransferase
VSFKSFPKKTSAFSEELRRQKAELSPSFQWYPYDTMANIGVLGELITPEMDVVFSAPSSIADIGCADGDLALFLEAQGHSVDVFDFGPTNMNGLKGARLLIDRRASKIGIYERDLDSQFTIDGRYDFIFFLGILYHLKNPFYVCEQLAMKSRFMALSTRIARRFSASGPDVSGFSAAYLLHATESNNDATNYWIFTQTGLHRLLERAGWAIERVAVLGSDDPNPQDNDRDARAFLTLRSLVFEVKS